MINENTNMESQDKKYMIFIGSPSCLIQNKYLTNYFSKFSHSYPIVSMLFKWQYIDFLFLILRVKYKFLKRCPNKLH